MTPSDVATALSAGGTRACNGQPTDGAWDTAVVVYIVYVNVTTRL